MCDENRPHQTILMPPEALAGNHTTMMYPQRLLSTQSADDRTILLTSFPNGFSRSTAVNRFAREER